MKIWTLKICTLALALGMACNTDGVGVIENNNPDDVNGNNDADGPLITCLSLDGSQPYGEDVLIECNAVDVESGVIFVSIFYKQETSTHWDEAPMRAIDAAGNYEGYIPGDDVASAGMNYYVSARDGADNESTFPEDGEDDAYHFRVSSN